MATNPNPDTILEIEEILSSIPTLPVAIKEEQKSLHQARGDMHAWFQTVKAKDSAGKPTGDLTCPAEDFAKRELDLAAKTAAFQAKAKPLILEHQLEQQMRIADALGKPRQGFSFGAAGGGKDSEIGFPAKGLYEHMQDSPEFKSMLENVPSNPGAGWNRRVKLERVNMEAIVTPQAYAAKTMGAMKTTLDTITGYPSPLNRGPLVVGFAHRQPVITDHITSIPFDGQFFVYMENTTWTNNAATVAESATKPESALGYTQRTAKIQVIAHTIPITRQALKFGHDLENTISREMVNMLRISEENEIVGGTGTDPHLMGVLTRPGLQSYTRSTTGTVDTNLDAIFKGMQQVRFIGYAEPDWVFLYPDNFTSIALLKDSLGDYIYSNPAQETLTTIWGKPFQQTQALPTGTGLTGDFADYTLFLRSGDVVIELGYVNNQFAQNQITLLVEEFVALVVKRPAAFSQILGLT